MADTYLTIEHELQSDGDGGEESVWEVKIVRWDALTSTDQTKLVATFYTISDASLFKSAIENALLLPFVQGKP